MELFILFVRCNPLSTDTEQPDAAAKRAAWVSFNDMWSPPLVALTGLVDRCQAWRSGLRLRCRHRGEALPHCPCPSSPHLLGLRPVLPSKFNGLRQRLRPHAASGGTVRRRLGRLGGRSTTRCAGKSFIKPNARRHLNPDLGLVATAHQAEFGRTVQQQPRRKRPGASPRSHSPPRSVPKMQCTVAPGTRVASALAFAAVGT